MIIFINFFFLIFKVFLSFINLLIVFRFSPLLFFLFLRFRVIASFLLLIFISPLLIFISPPQFSEVINFLIFLIYLLFLIIKFQLVFLFLPRSFTAPTKLLFFSIHLLQILPIFYFPLPLFITRNILFFVFLPIQRKVIFFFLPLS